MISGTTKTGFEFSIDEKKLNNMEFVDALAEVEDNARAFSRVINMMMDKEQKKRLYDHVRLEDGTVPVDAMVEEITDIMSSNAETKN